MLEVIHAQRKNTDTWIVVEFSIRRSRNNAMVFVKDKKNVPPTETIHRSQCSARNNGSDHIVAERDGEGDNPFVARKVLSADFIAGIHDETLLLQIIHPIMTFNPAQVIRHHMANQAAPAYSLIRKVCACGKASTAKQLAQHGKCAACALAAVRADILPGDFAKLQHMLGAVRQYPKSKWGWRNYFAAGGGQAREAMLRLVAAGLATAGRAANEMTYFHATRLGCKAAGLDGAGIKRAMED